MDPLFVREAEARRLLGNVSRETLWRWRKEGKLRATKVGAACLYPVEELRRFAAEASMSETTLTAGVAS